MGKRAKVGWGRASIAAAAAAVVTSGCAAHSVGWVDTASGRIEVVDAGVRARVARLGPGADLEHLTGFLVEVSGQRWFGGIRVVTLRVIEGPHGMSAWIGPVQRWGVQIGIADEGSGVLVWVDEATAGALGDKVGERVVAEGYTDGPQHAQIVGWEPLER